MKIDFTKLLGFDTVSHELSADLDLRDEALGDKLGAKIGPEITSPSGKSVDFQNDTIGSRLGAKVGAAESGGGS